MRRATVIPGSPMSERELFNLVQTGDREAFRVLFRQHQRPVYLAAYRELRSRPEAEEIMQDAFLTMWKKRVKIILVGESTLPWLLTTARFLAMNRRRAMARNPNAALDEATHLADRGQSPEDAAIAHERTEEIDALIASMPKVDQEILRLCLIEELSYEQAARRLGMSHGAVRNRLSRLKTRLRRNLDSSKEVLQS